MAPRATPRFLTRSAALLCAAVLVMVSLATAAAAADDPETQHPDPDAYRALAISLTRNSARVGPMAVQIDQITASIGGIDGQAATAQQQLDTTRAEIERLRTIVRGRAAFIYSHAQAPSVILDIPHIEDIASGKQYAQSASVSDANRITDLDNTADGVNSHLRDLQAARDAQVQQRDTIQSAKDSLEALIVTQKKQLDAVSTITVMGTSELTGDQINAWFVSRGVHYQLSGGTTIGELADMFVDEGAAEHVRGDIAFAQAVLETGSFAHAADNNYGGIGACDSCAGEIPFLSARDGVRGQIQMLRNYADPDSRAANLANPPSAPIYGSDPVGSARAYDTFFAKGRVPTWNLMGNGNWASSTEYSPKVLGIYFDMLAFADRT